MQHSGFLCLPCPYGHTLLDLPHCFAPHSFKRPSTGRVDAFLSNVARRVEDLAIGRLGIKNLTTDDIIASASRLGFQRLLLTDCASSRLRMRVSLNVPQADVVHALHEEASGLPWMRSLNF